MYRLAALWIASSEASTLVTKNTAITSCAHWPTNLPLRSSTRVPRSSLVRFWASATPPPPTMHHVVNV